jgi:hypothetical protein
VSRRARWAATYGALAVLYATFGVYYLARRELIPAAGWMAGAVQPAITALFHARAAREPSEVSR